MDSEQYFNELYKKLDEMSDEEFKQLLNDSGLEKCPYLTTSELGIPVFNKDTGKSSREIYNDDKDSLFESLYEDGKELRELLFSDMTDDEVREFINKSINEYRKEE